MIYCDTHSHIYLSEFDTDRDQILLNAKKNSVEKIFLPNVDFSSLKPLMDLCNTHPTLCFPIVGLHPCSINLDYKDELDLIFKNVNLESVIGIGEIGIDLYWDKTYLKQQQEALEKQLRIAQKLEKPVVIHTRDSFEIAYEIISSINNLKGVFHCFSGTLTQAKKTINSGFFIGIGGVVTFKNSIELQEIVREIPLEFIVLETDAPYLAPVPYRGKRNESSYIPIIAQKIAEIKSMSIEEVAEITTNNALKLFNLKK